MRTFVDRSPRNQLIAEHAQIARRIALKMARRCPDWVAREDLVSAGMVGLIEAADRYDGARQEPFISFAEHRIRGAVLDELRRGDIMPRRMRKLARKIAATAQALEKDGETPSEQQMADALGVSVGEYRTGLAQLAHVAIEPLEHEEATLASLDVGPMEHAAKRRDMDRVRRSLASLEARDVTILGLHYIEEMTYQEIAEQLHITPSRVCQLLWRAVERLRALMGEEKVAA